MEDFLPDLLKDIGIWATVPAAFFILFQRADKFLDKSFVEEFGQKLKGVQISANSMNWPDSFLTLIDGVFGKKALSWRFFLKSCLASIIAVLVLLLLLVNINEYVHTSWINFDIEMFIVIGISVNLVPDYISLIESRYIIQKMQNAEPLKIAGLLIADLIFTTMIFMIIPALFIIINDQDFEGVITLARLAFPSQNFGLLDPTPTFSIFFYSTFMTSIWVWLYVFSIGLFRLGSMGVPVFRLLQRALPLGTKPFTSIGVVTFFPPIFIAIIVHFAIGG